MTTERVSEAELGERLEKLVFSMVNDGKLNGVRTPQKPWVDQLLAICNEQRIDELKEEKHHFRNKISFYSNELDEYIDERVNELGRSRPPIKGHQKVGRNEAIL